MNPYFLGEAPEVEQPRKLLGQLASVELLGRRGVRLTIDAAPFSWVEGMWRERREELDSESISRFFETAPFFHFRATLGWPSVQKLIGHLLVTAPQFPTQPSLLGEWLQFDFLPSPDGNAISYSSASDGGTSGFVTLIDPAPQHLILYLNQFTPSVTQVAPGHPELQSALGNIPHPHAMAVLDVGQGSANVMLTEQGRPLLYFDAGRGIGKNWGTTPAGLEFCICGPGDKPVPVVLSHWHDDHFLGTKSDPDLLRCTWITPAPSTARHMSFQHGILAAGSKVLELSLSSLSFQFGASGSYLLTRSKGSPGNPNESGHALLVKQKRRRWLLPGDASYGNIRLSRGRLFTAVVATHHGGKFNDGTVPARAQGYARMVYSFGPSNSYSHPIPASVDKHSAQWSHGDWHGAPTPGIKSPWSTCDIRATSIHGGTIPPTHSGAVAVGWRAPPTLAGLAGACPTCGKSFNILQS